jgi:AcrR family transcriptional regulator
VTVEEICSAAGVGRTTFYLHFENKEQLLASLAAGTGIGVATDLEALGTGATLEDRLEVFIRGVVRRIASVPRSLTELVIHSQHVQLMKARVVGIDGAHPRFADVLRDVLADARRRGELVGRADPAELGEILGALTMDAIEAWASGRAREPSLEIVLRSRFALIVDPFRTDRV